MIDRRSFLGGAAALIAAPAASAAAETELYTGPDVKFSFDYLIGWAEGLRQQPYQPAKPSDPELIYRIDFDAYQEIKFRPELAIWGDGRESCAVELFHVGRYFKEPVQIYIVSRDGDARQVRYSSDLFTYGKSEFAKTLPPETGFAGFRVLDQPGKPDWLAFLGASYFRSCGATQQYGMSARGLAIDTALDKPEEFPRFTHFWLQPLETGRGLIINALLDSPSVTGAFRFRTVRDVGVLMDVEAHFFPRVEIRRTGVGALTSMFWYAKHNRKQATDWRPEIHDSDGLAIHTGAGERIFRPINNPTSVKTSSFIDHSPKGFGLMQRERRFSQYEDDGAFYDKRPSVWVEPEGDWGEGAVQLVEIPTHDEVDDNIVAYWVPKETLKAGEHRIYNYKVTWLLDEPNPPPTLARVVETRMGAGGIPGHPRPAGTVKYVVDFEGESLKPFSKWGEVEAVVSAPSGKIERAVAYPVVGTSKWRAMFDFTAASDEAVDIRLYLRNAGKALSETWIFQHLHSLLVL